MASLAISFLTLFTNSQAWFSLKLESRGFLRNLFGGANTLGQDLLRRADDAGMGTVQQALFDMLGKLYPIFENFGENIRTQTSTYVTGLKSLTKVIMDTLNQIGGVEEQKKGKFTQNSHNSTNSHFNWL